MHRLSLLFVSLLFFSLGRLPLRLRITFGRLLGFIFSLIPTREKKIAYLQMRLFLGEAAAKKALPKLFATFGQTFMECINLKPYLKDLDAFIECENWEIAEEQKREPKSVLTLTAHNSNWDLMGAYFIKKGFKVSTIGKKPRSALQFDLLSRIRDSYGIHTFWRDEKKGIKEIIDSLHTKDVLAALIDQDINVSSIYAPFFGMPAKYPSRLVSLALENGSTLVAAFIFRTGTSLVGTAKYKIFLHKLDPAGGVAGVISEYSQLLEKYIRIYPDQWVWFHKRWRSLENGKRLSSKEYLSFLEGGAPQQLDSKAA